MGVAELGCRTGFPAEAGDEIGILRERGAHHLEGDGAVQPGVAGLVDGGHAAPGDPRDHLVAPVHDGPDEGV